MPRTTITEGGFNSLVDHDTDAAWISFVSIGVHARESAEVKGYMAAIANPDAGDNRLYVCNNNVYTRAPRAGDRPNSSIIYEPYPFEVTLANASANRIQTVTMTFDNIDRTLVDVLRRAEYPLQIDYGLGMVRTVRFKKPTGVVNSEPATIAQADGLEIYVLGLQLRNVSWNKDVITGTLARDDVMNLAFPSNHPYYDHSNFPGLYGLSSVPLLLHSTDVDRTPIPAP